MIASVSILACLGASATAAALATAEYPAGVSVQIVSDVPDVYRTISNSKRDGLDKRANLGVFLCNDANFPAGSYCVHITAPAGVCVPLGLDLEDKVSAVRPDQGAYCRFFFDRDCVDNNGSRHFATTYPGIPDLSKLGGGEVNDQLSSYWCQPW